MSGVPVNLLARATFDDPAEVHDRHPVAHVLDHPEIVGDEQQREPELPLQVVQQVQYLGLDGDVERRHRLVRDDEARADRERARDPDALALAAAELVWIAVRRVGRQADEGEKLVDARAAPSAARSSTTCASAPDARPASPKKPPARRSPGSRYIGGCGRCSSSCAATPISWPIFERPLHPYTQALLRSMPGVGSERRDRLETIPGQVPDLLRLPSGCHFRDRCPKAISRCAEEDPALEEKAARHTAACIRV